MPPQEICGFNTGAFDYKIVEGKLDPAGIPWRLLSDLSLMVVASTDRGKVLVPLCKHLHSLATRNGLADISIREHELAPKLQPPVP